MRHLSAIASTNCPQPRISSWDTEFILLPFVGQEAPQTFAPPCGAPPALADALLLTAGTDFFWALVNHQPSWVKLGLAGATVALNWGCNDIGGTLMETHYHNGWRSRRHLYEVETLQAAISSLRRPYQQRDTLYGLPGP